jgi:hypothetical protein
MSYCLPWQVDGAKISNGGQFSPSLGYGLYAPVPIARRSPLHIDTQADDKELSKSVSSPILLAGAAAGAGHFCIE